MVNNLFLASLVTLYHLLIEVEHLHHHNSATESLYTKVLACLIVEKRILLRNLV
jgi:hypothetical protein